MAKPRDPALKNIERIRLPGGGWRYRVRMMVAGVKQRSSLLETLPEALALREQWEKGGLPSGDEPPVEDDPTVYDAIRNHELHLRENEQNPTPPQHLLGGLKRHYPDLLDLPVRAVHPEDHFLEFRQRRHKAGIKDNTILGNMWVLRAAIKRQLRKDDPQRAAEWQVPTGVFPLPNLTRVRQFTRVQWKQALLATREPAKSIAELAGVTAMRLSEILTLRVDSIDWTTRTITLRHTKAGPVLQPFGAYGETLLRRAVARAQARGHAILFGNPTGAPYCRGWIWALWKEAMRGLGHGHWTFHDLRHHAAMNALENGASFPELKEFGRWATLRHMERYARAKADRVRDLQDRGARAHAARTVLRPRT